MSDRRNFLKQTLLAAGAIALPELSKGNTSLPLTEASDSEQYWHDIRKQFPLKREITFLNNGTIGPSPYKVLRAVEKDMLRIEERGLHDNGEPEICDALGRFLNCDRAEVTLTHNVTEGINIVCWGLSLKTGDEVIITDNEHAGNASPWLNRAKLSGIILCVVRVGASADETIVNVRKAISSRTRAMSIPHITCTTGQVLPVKEICALAREKGIFTLLDGAHPPGMIQVDLHDIGCDAYAGCGHKWLLGPKGTGFLYIAGSSRDKVQAIYGGTGIDTGWDLLSSPPALKGYAPDGHRFYYGTQNTSLYRGLIAAIEFQEAIGKERIELRVRSLAKYLQEQLLLLGDTIEMKTPEEECSRGAQVSFKIKNTDLLHFNNYCRNRNVVTRFVAENDICCLRVSCHIYNNFTDIDRLLLLLDEYRSAHS